MNAKQYNIRIPGNSGCGVEIVSYCRKPAVRKWAGGAKDYAERLKKQREKQGRFESTIKAIHVPRIFVYDNASFTMEYLHMLDSIEFFEIARPHDIKCRLDLLFQFIAEELETAKSTHMNSNLFLDKLGTIERAVPPEIWRKYYLHHAQAL